MTRAILFVVVGLSFGAYGQTLSADADATGTLVAWLSESEIAASVTGELQWAGDAVFGERALSFSAGGAFVGVGVWGILTLVSEAWAGFSATGTSADGEAIELRGLLYVKRRSIVPLRADEVFVGTYYTVLRVSGETRSFCGGFSGAVAGGLEPADQPATIQLSGTGSLRLVGDLVMPSGELDAMISLNHPAVTLEFLQYIDDLGLSMEANRSTDP
jgi:hypothetical protein